MNPLAPVLTVLASLLLVMLARYFDSQFLFQLYLALTSIFLVLLVLVQKGRGGGLAGALGGPGGSSAFGAKAGDIFTRITILAALVWVIFAIGACLWAKQLGNAFGTGGGELSKPPASGTLNPSGENVPAPPTPPSEPTSGPDLGSPAGEDTATPPATPPSSSTEPATPASTPPASEPEPPNPETPASPPEVPQP